MFDDSLGQTILACDFLSEPLRRGIDPQEIYHRIVTGMPGTPHPKLVPTNADLRPLVFFIRSILPSSYPITTNSTRRRSVSGVNGPVD